MQAKVSSVFAFTAVVLLVGLVPRESFAQHPIKINEIRINQPGSDDDEFFELIGPPSLELTPYDYIVIGESAGGGSGVVEEFIDLDGQFINPTGFFVAGQGTFSLPLPLGILDMTTPLNFENNDNVTHMLVENFTGFVGQDLDLNDDCILDVFPWAVIVDEIGVILEPNPIVPPVPPVGTECHYGPSTVGPDGAFAPGHVHRCPDDTGAFEIADFNLGVDDTPGALNLCPPPSSPFEPGTSEVPLAVPTGCSDEGGILWDIVGSEVHEGGSVYGFSGEYTLSGLDLGIPGRGLGITIGRKYRSRVETSSAQGNGWDHAYNIKVEADGENRIVHDGNTRRDMYAPAGDGTWTRPEFFRVLTEEEDGSATLTFPDTGTWRFLPLDDPFAPGRITAIVDRNGNTISLAYDNLGQLTTVTDSLNRVVAIAHNADGFIESVCDWTDRCVTYGYYDGVEPGGSFGDLKSVTTPAVESNPQYLLPPGHEYPEGKTTIFTYTNGFADDRRNHNISTITDPKGQTTVSIEYSTVTDPNDPNFDRIVRQTLGNPGDTMNYSYIAQEPNEQNNFAVIKAIVNDRMGNVKERFYDIGNRLVMVHEYTGRAQDADAATTDTENRPINPLRDDDPVRFETRYEYNGDSLVTRIVQPNGNEEIFAYDEVTSDRRSQGNMLSRCRLPGPLGGDQPQICESFEFDPLINHDTNFVTQAVDGRGNQLHHAYDTSGNRTHTQHRIESIVEDFEYNEFGQMTVRIHPDNGSGHRRRDEYTYYDSGPQAGYLQSTIVDAPNHALTTTYGYDAVGNVTSSTDPRGHDTQYVVNQLNQIVRELSPEVELPNGVVRYERDTFYDANDNIVRVDIQNINDQGALQSNTHLTTIRDFEILNHCIRTCQEAGNAGLDNSVLSCADIPAELNDAFIVTEHELDANRNRVLTRFGEAVSGNDPDNGVQTLYDERDLPLQVIRAPGSAMQSTAQLDYDGNRNLTKTHQGLEDTARITSDIFDGYNRLISSTDPMGNVTTIQFDANGNRVSERQDGELIDVAGSAGNIRLSEVENEYDAMDRRTRTESAFFDTITQAPIMGGQEPGVVIYLILFNHNSQVISTTNDNGHTTSTGYDTANRVLTVSDPKANTRTHTYDANSNVIAVLETDKSDLGGSDEQFTTTFGYDNLDRQILKMDNVGNSQSFGYDSRNNQTILTDALGHETRQVFDGRNRLVKWVRDMDGNGADESTTPGDADPDIVTAHTFDDSSRLTARIDDNGNTTTTTYDALNRVVVETDADGTDRAHTYDVHDNRVTTTDANGSVSTRTYDLLDRLTHKSIAPGMIPGMEVSDDTTFVVNVYDGLSRLVHAQDDDSAVSLEYNSLSQVTRETLNGQATQGLYDGVGNKLMSIYPGGREIMSTFDELERRKTISDPSGLLASYDFVGGRVQRREYGNGTRSDHTYDGITGVPNPVNDFGVKRNIQLTHKRIADGTIIDDRASTWDRMYNKVQRRDVRAAGAQLKHDYAYDDAYRLIHTMVADGGGAAVRETDYVLDGMGNREQVSGEPDAGAYTMNPAMPEPADFQMNQYTTTPFDERSYDRNGNLIGIAGEAQIKYDYRDQMVEYLDLATGQRHTYAYDTMGRRIGRALDVDGAPEEIRYFYDGSQVVEERDALGSTRATYIYGPHGDDILTMDLTGVGYFYHSDDVGNVTAVTDANGNPVQRVEYGDYGQPRIITCPWDLSGDEEVNAADLAGLLGSWGPCSGCPADINGDGEVNAADLAGLLGSWGSCPEGDTIGNPYYAKGRRLDPETGWYYDGSRYLDPRAGRFTTRESVVFESTLFIVDGIATDLPETGAGRFPVFPIQQRLPRHELCAPVTPPGRFPVFPIQQRLPRHELYAPVTETGADQVVNVYLWAPG